ncbi:MAG: hypothetical protein ACOZB3_12060 [Calditrichota bacterium]
MTLLDLQPLTVLVIAVALAGMTYIVIYRTEYWFEARNNSRHFVICCSTNPKAVLLCKKGGSFGGFIGYPNFT